MAFIQKNGKIIEVPDSEFPEPTLAENKDDKMSNLAAKRYSIETGGITLNGQYIPTDRITQQRIADICKSYDDNDISGTIDFKMDNNIWAVLDEATFRQIKAAGAQHIQSCYSNEKNLAEQINNAQTQQELDSIDIETGWPT